MNPNVENIMATEKKLTHFKITTAGNIIFTINGQSVEGDQPIEFMTYDMVAGMGIDQIKVRVTRWYPTSLDKAGRDALVLHGVKTVAQLVAAWENDPDKILGAAQGNQCYVFEQYFTPIVKYLSKSGVLDPNYEAPEVIEFPRRTIRLKGDQRIGWNDMTAADRRVLLENIMEYVATNMKTLAADSLLELRKQKMEQKLAELEEAKKAYLELI